MAFLFKGVLPIIEDSFEEVHRDKFETCPICERKVFSTKMEIHHVLPKSNGGTHHKTMRLCAICHDVLHYFVKISDIVRYNTYEKIQKAEPMQKYLAWVRTKKVASYKIKKILKFIA